MVYGLSCWLKQAAQQHVALHLGFGVRQHRDCSEEGPHKRMQTQLQRARLNECMQEPTVNIAVKIFGYPTVAGCVNAPGCKAPAFLSPSTIIIAHICRLDIYRISSYANQTQLLWVEKQDSKERGRARGKWVRIIQKGPTTKTNEYMNVQDGDSLMEVLKGISFLHSFMYFCFQMQLKTIHLWRCQTHYRTQ